MFDQIIDANVNRIAEGLRVIEEYTRFVAGDETRSKKLASLRQDIHRIFPQTSNHLLIRDIEKDARAKQTPKKRAHVQDVLAANFKRVQEGLRVLEEYCAQSACSDMRYDMYQLEKDILLRLLKPEINPGFYLVSNDINTIKSGFLHEAVTLIQYRDKSISKEAYFNIAKTITEFSKSTKKPFIINDYIDIAMLLNIDGFHSGQDDISVIDQRKLLGPHKLIGRTTHSMEQGKIAQEQGADYVSIGPIWETPSKPGRPGIGFDYLKQAKHELNIPFVCIGGINASNIDRILPYNPTLIGIIRAFNDIENLIQIRNTHFSEQI
jgi:thiamine-phosphate pyrophosphorylase